jgi:hypothetical protein
MRDIAVLVDLRLCSDKAVTVPDLDVLRACEASSQADDLTGLWVDGCWRSGLPRMPMAGILI